MRMLDANLNRAQEAFRVVEDVLRFEYDSPLSREVKPLRHRFSRLAGEIRASMEVVKFRDSSADIMRADANDRYENKEELLYANIQRLKEALRVCEEALRLLDNLEMANNMGKIRFEVYDVEKKIDAEIFKKG